jgi:CheY-like chemotaxis protein
MTSLRILHIDDDHDIREVVELSLRLDSAFSVRSCSSGPEALATAVDWSPDMILCDVMMPIMDGPATLARLRECPQTVNTPVVFMTARAGTREIEHFKSLGATGVIVKPFDPMTLANSVHEHLRMAGLATLRGNFIMRMHSDAAALTECRVGLTNAPSSLQAVEQIKAFAHALVGSSGIFGFQDVSDAASVLEKTVIDQLAGNSAPGGVESDLDVRLDCIEHA